MARLACQWVGGWESCAHYGDQPGYPRREVEKEKARIEFSMRAFDSQDSVGERIVGVTGEPALEPNALNGHLFNGHWTLNIQN
jgi:hypothetical protein